MGTITTSDGTEIFYKDWGSGQPIVFSHGWPLSADDWDAQMLFFLHHGYRVIAHDRRGHGRSAQVSEGNDMDHYADDLAELTQHLDLHDAVHVGHSAGGGEVARYIGRHGESRVAKVVLISAVTPSVVQTDANPVGVPRAAFEGLQAQLAANRSEFIRQDYTEDLKKITVPSLVMHGEADQIVPIATSGPRAVELLKNGTLKTYAGFPHGVPTTHAETINADLLAFLGT
jgi:non-heme chloroperoxidase